LKTLKFLLGISAEIFMTLKKESEARKINFDILLILKLKKIIKVEKVK